MKLDERSLRGSYPPLVTPIRNGEVDYDAYRGLVEQQVVKESHGIVVNGTTAEPTTLSVEERNRLVEVAVETAAGRIPVCAATGSQSHAESVALTEHAEAAGADAVLVVTPYFIRPPQRGLVDYYVDLGRKTRLPFLIYHIPGRAAVSLDVETLRTISERTANFVGIKHAAPDLTLVSEALATLGPGFRVFVGLEELSLPMLAVGATGLMNAVGNLVPDRVAALHSVVESGNLERARKIHFELWELNRAVFFDMNPIPIKYMMRRLGILGTNEHRLPMAPATPELAERLDGVLARVGLLSA